MPESRAPTAPLSVPTRPVAAGAASKRTCGFPALRLSDWLHGRLTIVLRRMADATRQACQTLRPHDCAGAAVPWLHPVVGRCRLPHNDPHQSGRHLKIGRPKAPMAVSAKPARFTDVADAAWSR